MVKYTVYKAGGETELGELDWPAEPSYHQIKTFLEPYLDGGVLEHVTVFHEGKYTDMFVDEDGIHKGLGHNERATEVYHNNVKTHQPGRYKPEDLPPIVGPAVLFHDRVWF